MFRRSRATPWHVEVLEPRCMLSFAATDLGTVSLAAINNLGVAAGTASNHAVVETNGSLIDLGTLGGASSRANGINNLGQVVGSADRPGGTRHAFLVTPQDTTGDGQPDVWFRDDDHNGTNDLMVDLGTLGGPTSEARGINDLGQVVGRADSSFTAGSYRAFVWDSNSGMQNLGTFGLSVNLDGLNFGSEANAINDHGQVVGSVYSLWRGMLFNGVQGFRWDPQNGGSLLGSIYGGARQATGINDAGQIVGNSGRIYALGIIQRLYVATDAFLWQNGAMTSLGFAMNSVWGANISVNDNGQIVGGNYLWQSGVRMNLNNLIDPSPGWTISTTADINDSGQIVAQRTLTGQNHGFVLTADPSQPVCFTVTGFPTPTTAGVAGSLTVTALNGLNAPAAGYTGKVHFVSSDQQAALPGDYTFRSDDGGIHPFNATLKTAGSQSIAVGDTVVPGIMGTAAGIFVTPAAAHLLQISGPGSVKARAGFGVIVTVFDSCGNIATGYTGMVAFKSSDAGATLPGNYAFSAADMGVHSFTGFVFKRKGTQTLLITDTLNAALQGRLTLSVV
jgi:probable HAF family extracellular repeat protein